VVVLEARDRVGGRSQAGELHGAPVDVGGQWVGASHTQLMALAGRQGVRLRPQYDDGERILYMKDRVRRFSGNIPKVNPVALVELELALRGIDRKAQRLPLARPWAMPGAARFDGMTLETWAKRHLRTKAARGLFDAGVRAVFSAEPNALSFLYFLFYCASNDGFETLIGVEDAAQAYLVDGGMHRLAVGLADGLGDRVRLNAPVARLEQHPDAVELTTPFGGIRARHVVMAVPPTLESGIELGQNWDPRRRHLAMRMPMGSVIKCLVAYDRPFWRDAGLTGEAVSHELPFSPVFDATPADESFGALVGFFDGAPAATWSPKAENERRAAVVDSLVKYFGDDAGTPTAYIEKNWIADPWSRGCYVGLMPPGVMTELGDALRRPVGRVHFAGTEIAQAYCGYIEGAIRSGERVAKALTSDRVEL